MKTNYATMADRNGNRKILIVDHERREYSRESYHWYCWEDFTLISLADFRRMEEKTEKAGYKKVERLET